MWPTAPRDLPPGQWIQHRRFQYLALQASTHHLLQNTSLGPTSEPIVRIVQTTTTPTMRRMTLNGDNNNARLRAGVYLLLDGGGCRRNRRRLAAVELRWEVCITVLVAVGRLYGARPLLTLEDMSDGTFRNRNNCSQLSGLC